MRSYTVIGAGAVGLLYGTRLAVAGHPVRWLVRSGHDEIARDGITVRTEGTELHLAPDDVVVTTDPDAVPPSDVVLVATKTTANDRLVDLVAGVCPDGATVAVFQNGLGAEELVRAGVPAAGSVVGGLCFVCCHRTAPGVADHLDYGAVTLADLDGGTAVAGAIADDLRASGVEAAAHPDLAVARWRKLVWNIPFNGLCAVLDARTDDLLGQPPTRALVADLMDEVIAAANALGHGIDPGFRDEMLATTDAMRPYDPSMKLDLAAGRAMEIGAIYDAAIERARAAAAPMLRTEVLAAQLRHLDRAGT